MQNIIENKQFSEERALYGRRDLCVRGCRFAGEEDGESALKECRNIEAENCFMDLRYPFWHVRGLRAVGCELTQNCRAAMWYDAGVRIENCKMNGIKALRECADVHMRDTCADSPEFGWRCRGIAVEGGEIKSEYAFFESKNIAAENLRFEGKYSFQYVRDAHLRNCTLSTKDAFWHSVNVTVENCLVKGEYTGWYAQNLTFINCRIEGTQPLCYCKGVKLIDCQMINTDLCFEKSDVSARLTTPVLSIKNPRSGEIFAPAVGEVIRDDPASCCRIVTRG